MSLIKKMKRKSELQSMGLPSNKKIRESGFETPKNDLSGYTYTRTWDQGLCAEVYGYEVPIPDMPPKEEIINYGRPISEQIFRKTKMPDNLSFLPEDEQEAFISMEHHRRVEGLWFYIKGQPIYIPGLFYYFLNYWPLSTGASTKFHMGDWKFFIIWMYVVMTDTIFGLLVFKCRRIGDTEKGLCMMYEYSTRVRNTINQMYDCRVEKDMIKTWKRLKIAHQRMSWFMRPVTKNDDPSNSYEFRTPKRKVDTTNSYVNEDGQLVMTDYKYRELDSEISYFTNEGGADGARVGRSYIDEFGKYNQIDPEELWGLMKKALEDDREGTIIGKSLWTSTIEEMKGGETLKKSKKMWASADPSNVGPDGRTVSGLVRIVRGALDRAPTDRWGFVDEKEELRKIKERQDFYVQNKEWDKLIKDKRQNCLNIEDVFSNISKGSPFNLTNINNRKNELEYGDNVTWVRGNFEWKDGIKPIAGDPNNTNKKCRVYFDPNDNGRYIVSWHPKDMSLQDNAMEMMSLVPKPGNTSYFSAGIDPVAYRNNLEDKDKASLSGMAIKRNLDPSVDKIDDATRYDSNRDPVDFGRNFRTNRYCCVYLYRHDQPSANFEDWLKALIYYGADFLIEKNHSAAFNTYLEMMGFDAYHYDGGSGISNYRGKQETLGITATEKSIDAYFAAIAELCSRWINTIDITLILEQLSTMEYETRGDHDLGVAVGMCELLSQAKAQMITATREYQSQDDFQFIEENTFSSD